MLISNLTPKEPLKLALKRLSEFFRVLSNSRRILIIEELRDGEKDVSSIASSLRLHQSAISKHLSVLRSHRLVVERKEGRSVFYRLSDPELAAWIVDGLKFAGPNLDDTDFFLQGVEQVRSEWMSKRNEEGSK